MSELNPIRISDKLTNSISELYKIGGLGLVFIFLGFLTMLFSFLFPDSKFSIPFFIVGTILLLSSFFIFIVMQYKVPIKAKRNIDDSKTIIDGVQDLSIALVKLTYNTQSYCFKNIGEIQRVADSFVPLATPFLGEKGREFVIDVKNVSNGIVKYSQETELVISKIEKALEQGDVKELEKYKAKLIDLNSKMQKALKE